ncbi:mechanosensitive ion channel [Nitzschia inconspicua]|uniref:Mechanosensitive ion channel n=1 Tax=Nitzschia inconspicua TaxID=303405 RepID=A0A9K3PPM4_9STRA|nr:mechanosensitive ion channel [Nitzschia inconspicua]
MTRHDGDPAVAAGSPAAKPVSPRPPLRGHPLQLSATAPLPPHTLRGIERPSKMTDRKISWDLEEDYPRGDDGGKRFGDGKQETSDIYLANRNPPEGAENSSVRQTLLQDASTSKEVEKSQGTTTGREPDTSTIKKQPSSHKRQISWGGTTIEIPQAYEEHFSMDSDSSVLSPQNDERSDQSVAMDDEERFRLASKAVVAAEAALFSRSPDQRQSSYESLHNRLSSSISSNFRIQLEDLARAYPIESEAETHILRAIEATEAKRGAVDGSNAHEGDEGVAKLLTPVTQNLLGNVPEGAEGIFQRETSASSMAGNSASGGGSTNDSRRQQWNRRGPSHDGTHSGGTKSSDNSNFSPTSQPNVVVPLLSRSTSIGSTSYGKHNRLKTMEEHLQILNQAFDSVDKEAAEMIFDDPSTAIGDPPPPTTNHDEYGLTDNLYSRARGRSTSLDLFNENMARLFQDVGVNDTRDIPVLEQETVPLTENSIQDGLTTKTSGDNANESKGYLSSNSELGKEVDRDADYNSMSQLDGEKITHGSEYASDDLSTTQDKKSTDIESGTVPSGRSCQQCRSADVKGMKKSVGNSGRVSLHSKKKKKSFVYRSFSKLGVVQNIDDFLKPRRPSIWRFLRAMTWLVLTASGISVILFYASGNPPTGIVDLEASQALNGTSFVTTDGRMIDPYAEASHSWWILYACVRLPITFALARFFQVLFIDFLILERRCILSCMGPTLTLLLVQSKGWPAIMFFWSLCNIGLLYGNSSFVSHWGYWQGYVDLFNESNPSGSVVTSTFNLRVQLCALGVSIVVAIKRLLIGFYQGRKTFLTYAEDLSDVMTKILLVSEVANLSARVENEFFEDADDGNPTSDNLNRRASTAGIDDAARRLNRDLEDEEEEKDGESSSHYTTKSQPLNPSKNKKFKTLVISENDKNYATGRLSQSQKRRIERLLGNWEEPEKESVLTDSVSIGAILQFRTSLSKLNTSFPFSYAFGRADTRDSCIESSQELYLRLLGATRDQKLHFNILGLVALQRDGTLDQEKLKSLIKVFRPGRDGNLGLVDFVKSVDAVYKEMKLLRASVRSSQKIDQSFEWIFNILFFVVTMVIVMSILGLDPLALFVSVSTFVLAFSFMISRASSNYFEGLLFILCRRPYDIGDRIVIQNCEADTAWGGSTDWIVRDIDLFTTTVLYAYTNEIATLSNGSIANSRVMNGARSLPGILYVHLRFGIDVTAEQLDVFREALYQWVLSRPREWSKLWDVRNMAVSADQGFVEYMVILEHVENWQNLDSLLYSRGQARKFCHELSKQLDMRYISPPLPVDLRLGDRDVTQQNLDRSGDAAKYMAESQELIRSLIQKHR